MGQIPITYAPKEKWLVRLEQDPDLENHTYITLPRMSFEIVGYNYDSTRKVPKMNKIVCHSETGAKATFSPVPYELTMQLYIGTKTQEDGLQIIEQILPNFGPEYTLTINAIPAMNIKQDVPITLNSINMDDEYDGNFDRRMVIHTLTFSVKINLYNAVGDNSVIYTSIADLGGDINSTFTAVGDPVTYTITSETWTDEY